MSEPVVVLGSGGGALAVWEGLTRKGRAVTLISPGALTGDPSLPARHLIDLAREGSLSGAEVLSEVRLRRAAHLQRLERVPVVRGEARFLEPYLLEVRAPERRRLETRHIVIATGSEPVGLEIPGLPAERSLTSASLYDLETPPEHLAVVGGGDIALESACAFRRLGSRVTLLARSGQLLSREGPSVSEVLLAALRRRGIDVRLGVEPFLYADGRLELRPEGAVDRVDAVLVAVGRNARLEALDLDRAGLRADDRGLPVDDWCRTVIRGIYAVGDATGLSRSSHTARAQARKVVQHLTHGWLPESPPAWIVPSVVLCDPEVASVQLGRPVAASRRQTLRVDLGELDRGSEGFLELEIDRRSGCLQRVTLVAPRASETISLFTLAMEEKVPLERLARLVTPSPGVLDALARLSP